MQPHALPTVKPSLHVASAHIKKGGEFVVGETGQGLESIQVFEPRRGSNGYLSLFVPLSLLLSSDCIGALPKRRKVCGELPEVLHVLRVALDVAAYRCERISHGFK
jgi:hypothetical protein